MPPRKAKAKAKGQTKPIPKKARQALSRDADADADDSQDDSASPKPHSRKRKRDLATPQSDSNKRRGTSAKSEATELDWEAFDKKYDGFKVKTAIPKATQKQTVEQPSKRQADAEYDNGPMSADVIQKNPYSERSISKTHYAVTPAAEWESTMRFRKCTISDTEFEVGQTVFVNKGDQGGAVPNWIARILEIRAGDTRHVFLRVYWMYRPEDIPEGRQPYHGENELIASNGMDIIDALTVNDHADVIYWDENPDSDNWPAKDQLFWRQTLDLGKPKAQQLSELRTYCVDEQPCNPDEVLMHCRFCNQWLHARCLEERAVADAKASDTTAPQGPKKGKGKRGRKKKSPNDSFTASLATGDSDDFSRLTVTDNRPGQDSRQWNVDVICLLCRKTIDKATKDLSPEATATDEGDEVKTVSANDQEDEVETAEATASVNGEGEVEATEAAPASVDDEEVDENMNVNGDVNEDEDENENENVDKDADEVSVIGAVDAMEPSEPVTSGPVVTKPTAAANGERTASPSSSH